MKEIFTEAAVPLVEDLPWVRSPSAELGFKIGDTISIVTGVNNILDKEPPLVSLNISTNYFNTVDGYYDMLGRFLHLSATVKF